MMANRDGAGGRMKTSSSAPVKWTLVEAEPEKPEGRRNKQQGYGRARAQGSGGSGSTTNWRSGREGGRGRGGQGFSGGYRGGRRGGGGGNGGRSSARHNTGNGRARGYAAERGHLGATYYPIPYFNEPSFEEHKAYMTNLAVRQIEFYFTVENLCRDIFMRSYMDEEGYIPIAFVANFPGVARFGVELQDIIAGLLASDLLQVDTENETMRMREGWEVWLLPNQATGKRGVPRYIKVDATAVSDEAQLAEFDETPQTSAEPNSEGAADGKKEACEGATLDKSRASPLSNGKQTVGMSHVKDFQVTHVKPAPTLAGKTGGEVGLEEPAPPTNGIHQLDGKTGLTPTAAAWTPGFSFETCAEQEEPLEASVVEKEPNDAKICPRAGSADHEAVEGRGDTSDCEGGKEV